MITSSSISLLIQHIKDCLQEFFLRVEKITYNNCEQNLKDNHHLRLIKNLINFGSFSAQPLLQNYFMSDVQGLVSILQSYSTNNYQSNYQSTTTDLNKSDQRYEQMKSQMSKVYRPPWKTSGIPQTQDKILALKNIHLDNWQIARISLSKRSYIFPKNYHGLKIPAIGKEFSRYYDRDAQGHFPLRYEGEKAKIQKIKDLISEPRFAKINTAKNQYFGLGKIRPKMALNQKKTAKSHSFC